MTKNTVHLFTTCLVDQVYPQIGVAVVKLIRRAGFEVVYPVDQVCCGQPFYNSGYHSEAMRLAVQTIEVLEDAEWVVIPSGSCTAMIRHEYPKLFAGQPTVLEKAERLAAKTFELTEFLFEKTTLFADNMIEQKSEITYHDSCHMCRNLGIRLQPRELLKACGYRIREMEESDRCCGFGGVFFARMPEISRAMVTEKLRLAHNTGVHQIVTADPGCMMRMLQDPDRDIDVRHISELLEEVTR